MMFKIDKFCEILLSEVFEYSVFEIKSYQLCVLRFVSSCVFLIIRCSNALAESISLTLISVLERFSVPP